MRRPNCVDEAKEEATKLFHKMDVNHDGRVSFQEFVESRALKDSDQVILKMLLFNPYENEWRHNSKKPVCAHQYCWLNSGFLVAVYITCT